MSTTLEQLETSLPHLNSQELRDLRARIDALTSTADVGQADGLVAAYFVRVLKELGIDVPSVAGLKRMPFYAKFREGAVTLLAFIDEHVQPQSQAERAQVCYCFIKLIARDVQQGPAPLTPKTLALRLAKVGSVVDQQFPGYLASGLLPFILRRLRAA